MPALESSPRFFWLPASNSVPYSGIGCRTILESRRGTDILPRAAAFAAPSACVAPPAAAPNAKPVASTLLASSVVSSSSAKGAPKARPCIPAFATPPTAFAPIAPTPSPAATRSPVLASHSPTGDIAFWSPRPTAFALALAAIPPMPPATPPPPIPPRMAAVPAFGSSLSRSAAATFFVTFPAAFKTLPTTSVETVFNAASLAAASAELSKTPLATTSPAPIAASFAAMPNTLLPTAPAPALTRFAAGVPASIKPTLTGSINAPIASAPFLFGTPAVTPGPANLASSPAFFSRASKDSFEVSVAASS